MPNDLGLHDVLGNVAELCDLEVIDGLAQRGGGMIDRMESARFSFFRPLAPGYSLGDLGVRPVRSVR